QRPPRYSAAPRRPGGCQKSRYSRAPASAWRAFSNRVGAGGCGLACATCKRPRRRLKSTVMTLLRAGCNLARKLAASYWNVNARRRRASVAAVAGVGLERELLEQPLLGLTHRNRAQHLPSLLRQRHRRHDAGQLGHRELADRLLHLVQHGARDLAHLHGSRQLECLVEALGEARTRLGPVLGRRGNVQLGGGGVVELVEGGEDGVAGRHAPHVYTIRLEANPRLRRALAPCYPPRMADGTRSMGDSIGR